MYNKDKTHRITLRLTDDQFEFVRENAEMVGVSPSEFLRMVVNMTMSTTRKVEKKMNDKLQEAADAVALPPEE